MSFNTLFIILLIGAAIPANGFVVIYSRAPWWKKVTGRAVWTLTVCLALMVNFGIVTRTLGEGWKGQTVARCVIFGFLFIGLWVAFIALLWAERPKVKVRDDG